MTQTPRHTNLTEPLLPKTDSIAIDVKTNTTGVKDAKKLIEEADSLKKLMDDELDKIQKYVCVAKKDEKSGEVHFTDLNMKFKNHLTQETETWVEISKGHWIKEKDIKHLYTKTNEYGESVTEIPPNLPTQNFQRLALKDKNDLSTMIKTLNTESIRGVFLNEENHYKLIAQWTNRLSAMLGKDDAAAEFHPPSNTLMAFRNFFHAPIQPPALLAKYLAKVAALNDINGMDSEASKAIDEHRKQSDAYLEMLPKLVAVAQSNLAFFKAACHEVSPAAEVSLKHALFRLNEAANVMDKTESLQPSFTAKK